MKSFILLFTLLMLAGCSKQALDEDTASSGIQRKLRGEVRNIHVYVGRVGSHCSATEIGGKKYYVDMNPDKDMENLAAQKAGYITVAPDGTGYWKVALTSQGQALIDAQNVQPAREVEEGCDNVMDDFPAARPVLVKITQITGDDQAAEATYLWKWTLTDLGAKLRENGSVYTELNSQQRKVLSERLADPLFGFPISLPFPSEQDMNKTYEAKVRFKKTDDGWRPQ